MTYVLLFRSYMIKTRTLYDNINIIVLDYNRIFQIIFFPEIYLSEEIPDKKKKILSY